MDPSTSDRRNQTAAMPSGLNGLAGMTLDKPGQTWFLSRPYKGSTYERCTETLDH
ncbi:hypothetical protein [Roseibium alexandrii]|uniref:hypothetical protein n=1 Tax=Roseibium alexandrii TaxID=388408 RepID=UPI0001947687|nr:hypothetical protein [Roseibium alexandrii]